MSLSPHVDQVLAAGIVLIGLTLALARNMLLPVLALVSLGVLFVYFAGSVGVAP